ncbi:hypothetical protein PV327_000779 [Microctonus hyperodae]|uniref:Uncharacterized protein n=1 Tax=Microctonus hyperodae TaxID=165561 RepID=A0AA39L2Q7_MICHY|nr:hypothetical protein PV327_000779 [Microctonus hyperodae]
MNSNNREHPADFKAKEILTKLSTKFLEPEKKIMKNNKNHINLLKYQFVLNMLGPTLSSKSSNKSSINLDICCELDQQLQHHSNRGDTIKQQRKYCNYNSDIFNKEWNLHTSVDMESLLGCEKELYFIRAVTWMKSVVQTMEEVSQNDIQEIFKDLNDITHLNNSSSSLFSINNSTQVQNFSMIQTLQSPTLSASNVYANRKRHSNNCDSDHDGATKKLYRIPDEELEVIMSPLINFGENSEDEFTVHNDARIDEDSGFLSKVSSSNHHKDKSHDKKLEQSDETISSAALLNLIDSLRLNNFVLGEVRIILSVLESNETAQNYEKNGTIVKNGINIIVQFLNQLVTEDDMSSSGAYLQLCTKYIMTTIRKIFDSKSYRSLTSMVRQNQMKTILGFCNFRPVCEKTIDLIINILTDIIAMMTNVNLDEYAQNQPIVICDSDSHLFSQMLPVVVKKYLDIVGPSRNINENSHYYTTYVWRKLWKNHKHYDVSEFRSKELENDWVTRLEKLIDPELSVEGFSIFGDYKSILIAIKMLSTASLECNIN